MRVTSVQSLPLVKEEDKLKDVAVITLDSDDDDETTNESGVVMSSVESMEPGEKSVDEGEVVDESPESPCEIYGDIDSFGKDTKPVSIPDTRVPVVDSTIESPESPDVMDSSETMSNIKVFESPASPPFSGTGDPDGHVMKVRIENDNQAGVDKDGVSFALDSRGDCDLSADSAKPSDKKTRNSPATKTSESYGSNVPNPLYKNPVFYDAGFKTVLGEEPSKEGKNCDNLPSAAQRRFCFNCDGDHYMRDCKKPLDAKMIHKRRALFRREVREKSLRYHEQPAEQPLDEKYPDFKPGVYSDVLRIALGVAKNQLPEYLYKMRLFGYPPGWKLCAINQTTEIKIYEWNGELRKPVFDPEEQAVKLMQNLPEYPGFTTPVPETHRDDGEWLHNIPFNPDFSRKNIVKKWLEEERKQGEFEERPRLTPKRTKVTSSRADGDKSVTPCSNPLPRTSDSDDDIVELPTIQDIKSHNPIPSRLRGFKNPDVYSTGILPDVEFSRQYAPRDPRNPRRLQDVKASQNYDSRDPRSLQDVKATQNYESRDPRSLQDVKASQNYDSRDPRSLQDVKASQNYESRDPRLQGRPDWVVDVLTSTHSRHLESNSPPTSDLQAIEQIYQKRIQPSQEYESQQVAISLYREETAKLMTGPRNYRITEEIERRQEKYKKMIEAANKAKQPVVVHKESNQTGRHSPSLLENWNGYDPMQIPPPSNSTKAIQNNDDNDVVVLPRKRKPEPKVVTISSDEEDEKKTKSAQYLPNPFYKKARMTSEVTPSNLVQMIKSSLETPVLPSNYPQPTSPVYPWALETYLKDTPAGRNYAREKEVESRSALTTEKPAVSQTVQNKQPPSPKRTARKSSESPIILSPSSNKTLQTPVVDPSQKSSSSKEAATAVSHTGDVKQASASRKTTKMSNTNDSHGPSSCSNVQKSDEQALPCSNTPVINLSQSQGASISNAPTTNANANQTRVASSSTTSVLPSLDTVDKSLKYLQRNEDKGNDVYLKILTKHTDLRPSEVTFGDLPPIDNFRKGMPDLPLEETPTQSTGRLQRVLRSIRNKKTSQTQNQHGHDEDNSDDDDVQIIE